VRQLQDVLQEFAKNLVLLLNISDLKLIYSLKWSFQEYKGDNTVSFEIMEIEKLKD
jgi:DNA polymerase-3 subunit alpha